MLISNFLMIIISTSLTVPTQPSPRFHVEAWLAFRNREMDYLRVVKGKFNVPTTDGGGGKVYSLECRGSNAVFFNRQKTLKSVLKRCVQMSGSRPGSSIGPTFCNNFLGFIK